MAPPPPDDFNPFGPGNAGANFVGRERAVSRFEQALKGLRAEQPAHLFVAGVNGTGKTSYLQHVAEIARGRSAVAVVLTLDQDATADAMMKAIVEAVLRRVEQDERYEGPALYEDWQKGSGSTLFAMPRSETIFAETFRRDLQLLQTLTQDYTIGTVVCLDEAQRVQPQALSRLKNALQDLNRYLVVMSIFVPEARDVVQEARDLLSDKAAQTGGDYGAASFLSAGLAMGPFESELEAQACVLQRLEGNALTFTQDVVDAVARIEDRIPRRMIRLAYHVYAAASEDGASEATMEHVQRAFASEHQAELQASEEIVARLSPHSQRALLRVAELTRPVTAREVAAGVYGVAVETLNDDLTRLTEADLALAHGVGACTHEGDRYAVPDSAMAFALRVLLQS